MQNPADREYQKDLISIDDCEKHENLRRATTLKVCFVTKLKGRNALFAVIKVIKDDLVVRKIIFGITITFDILKR